MKLRHVIRIALWAAILFALVMAFLPKPPHLPIDRFGDKFGHMLAFGTITLLSALAYPKFPLVRIGERLSLLGAVIELVQALPMIGRDRDIMDWVADTVIVIVMLVVVGLARSARKTASGPSDPVAT